MANNETKIIIAGFGGQGVVVAGNILVRAAMMEGKYVTGMVSYGAEMRGGTANSTVVISDGEISSPYVERPNAAMILNQPSLDKFEERLESGSKVLINTSLVLRDVKRDDIDVVGVRASEIARDIGNVRVANIVALGGFARSSGIVSIGNLEKAVEELFGKKKKSGLVEINIEALSQGVKAAEKACV